MVTLILHNLPEGIITFLSSYTNLGLGIKLSIAIAMHNIPEGVAIAVPIYYSTGSKKEAILKTTLSGLSEPIGALIAYIFLSKYITSNMIAIILIIVSGLMITLAIEQMLPEALKYKENKYIYFGIILGIIVIIINTLL
ncbi:MAG: ZIP family metal transporter [Bacilli bacterium]|nr:ZIP family metal transporter [Bacilli bacterium]